MNHNRRRYLQGLLAVPLVSAMARTRAAQPALLTRPYGATGLRLPAVGLGTWQQLDHALGSQAYLEASDALYAFLDGGGRVIDSSPMYGQSEARVGDALRSAERPERAFVATKIWARGENAGQAQLAQSRQIIGRPLDLVQVHNLVDLQVQLKTLRAAKDAGLVRSIGVTHYLASAHAEMEKVLRRERPDAVQINYSVAEPDAGKRLLRVAEELGIAVLINRPFASGQLFDRVRALALPAIAQALECRSWAQLFLKWIFADSAVCCALVGTSSVHHVADNLAAASLPLPDPKQRDEIMQVWRNAR